MREKNHPQPSGLPVIEGFHLWHRKQSNLAYAIFILFTNLAIPCILFYPLKQHTNLSYNALIGIASATLGISSSCDGPFRMWKLWKHRDVYGPLKDENKWHLDFTMHLYSVALLIFAIPLAVASAVHPAMKNFFNMSTPMLVAPIGIVFFISLFHPRLPGWISSDPPRTPMKPAMFYVFEDIGAVDFRFGRRFREAVNRRYDASPPFPRLMTELTAFWAFGCAAFYPGITAALNWTIEFDVAFGLILGVFFLWLVAWACMSLFIIQFGLKREEKWWQTETRSG